ncbi:MAG: glutamate--tRNA ligase [Cyclobacteriaceae bacterium]|nr:glutamate--tRNA ligase [Cyclobacteriaceae bacterium]
MTKVRVRFAPSPTGALHIGGIRTALYNFLLARKTGGTMILRIEDTDQTRFVPGAEKYILESLAWVGIKIDEGVGPGGPHAPYRQSERKDIYSRYASQLVADGKAYYAFDTEADLEEMRKRTPNAQYDAATRMSMKNALTLSKEEVSSRIAGGAPHVVRLLVSPGQEVLVNDLIRGEVNVSTSQLDDKVLMKSDGMPTYHLANVVDDHLMEISHVIRGEEWLPSAPHHVLLYKAFGWESSMPRFAHLPLLLKPDGNGKLSKRDADRMGFPIFPLNWTDPKTNETSTGFRETGYLPEAMINFLVMLGWNPGTPQEIFSQAELIEAFSLERVGKAGAKFDILKAQWYNQHYLRAKPIAELSEYLLSALKNQNISCSADRAIQIVTALKDRVTYPQDFWEQGKLFFVAPDKFDDAAVSRKWNAEAVKFLKAFRDEVGKEPGLNAERAKGLMEEVAVSQAVKPGQVLAALRIALTGGMAGPDLMQTIEILGGEETARRIAFALQSLSAS